jgi:hypothetical protein
VSGDEPAELVGVRTGIEEGVADEGEQVAELRSSELDGCSEAWVEGSEKWPRRRDRPG